MLTPEARKNVLTRLKRIEGQLAGVRRMVESDKYCVDILTQMAAAQGAIGGAAKVVLGSHLETCVSRTMGSDDAAQKQRHIEELLDVFAKFARK